MIVFNLGARAAVGSCADFIPECMNDDKCSAAGFACRHVRFLDHGMVQCLVCPHQCLLKEGQRGICYVRQNVGGRLCLLSYGRLSAIAIDPIEKKPLYHFLPDTPTFSVGGIGCNLSCRFCQNWHISKPSDDRMLREIAAPEDIARAAVAANCPSVSFTYNEPVVALEFVVDTARACHQAGLRTIAVTNGYITDDARAEFFAHMDAANVDIKAFTDNFYRKLSGARLAPVLKTLQFLKRQSNVWFEITNLIIPGENDAPAEVDVMTRWIVAEIGCDVPLHFSAFFPAFRLTDHPPTNPEILRRARTIARKNGIRHVYIGNTEDAEGQTTRCASCGATLIERSWIRVVNMRILPNGACPDCGSLCPGVFSPLRYS